MLLAYGCDDRLFVPTCKSIWSGSDERFYKAYHAYHFCREKRTNILFMTIIHFLVIFHLCNFFSKLSPNIKTFFSPFRGNSICSKFDMLLFFLLGLLIAFCCFVRLTEIFCESYRVMILRRFPTNVCLVDTSGKDCSSSSAGGVF